jgi:hypothetical protein
MPDDGKVADIRGSVACHGMNDEPDLARVQALEIKASGWRQDRRGRD